MVKTNSKGSNNPNAKLTPTQRQEMAKLFPTIRPRGRPPTNVDKTTYTTQRQIALSFGIHVITVRKLYSEWKTTGSVSK